MDSIRGCSVEECDRAVTARGYCMKHYKRWRRWGDPLGKRAVLSAAERFDASFDRAGAIPADRPGLGRCWPWTRGISTQGYGHFHPARGVTVLAHRFAYESSRGPIPDGLFIDHLCRNRACVNPEHLEAVTNEENLRRGWGYRLRNGMANACINGHEYTPENTYRAPAGEVMCRQCARDRYVRKPSRTRPIDTDQVVTAYLDGAGATQIAKRLHVGLSRVIAVLEEAGIERRGSGRVPKRKDVA